MSIASGSFLAFVIASLLVFHLPVRAAWWRQGVLLAATVVFFASQLPAGAEGLHSGLVSLAPLLLFVGSGYAALPVVRLRYGLAAVILSILTAYLWLRRFGFVESLAVIPFDFVSLGVSYILFRMLQVLIDYAQGEIRQRPPLLQYLLHLFSFYTLVSGPIWRYQDHQRQLDELPGKALTEWDMYDGLSRIMTGFIKSILVVTALDKAFLASVKSFDVHLLYSVTQLNMPNLATISAQAGAMYALGASAYLVSLYFNFSGYMDIVNGCAKLFLLSPPENFLAPFQSKNFSDIWSRWHITLSEWFKMYMFNPLVKLLSTSLPAAHVQMYGVAAYFLTFFVLGVWHGTTERFAYYGLALGFCVSANKFWDVQLGRRMKRPAKKALQAHPVYAAVSSALGLSAFAASLSIWWVNAIFVKSVSLRSALFFAVALGCLLGVFFCVTRLDRLWRAWSAQAKARPESPYGRLGLYQVLLFVKILLVLVLLFTSGHSAPQFVYQNF